MRVVQATFYHSTQDTSERFSLDTTTVINVSRIRQVFVFENEKMQLCSRDPVLNRVPRMEDGEQFCMVECEPDVLLCTCRS